MKARLPAGATGSTSSPTRLPAGHWPAATPPSRYRPAAIAVPTVMALWWTVIVST